jgi:MFS family permease
MQMTMEGLGESWREDRWLLRPKALHLLLNMAVYSCYHFGMLYFHEVWAVPEERISLLNTLTALGFVGSLMWTWLADRFQRHRFLLVSLVLGYALCFCSLHVFEGMIRTLPRTTIVFVVFFASSFFISGLYPLLDNRVFLLLPAGQRELYGRQRLWGAVGQALVGPLQGQLSHWLKWRAMFLCVALFSLLFASATLLLLPSRATLQLKSSAQNSTANLLEGQSKDENKLPKSRMPNWLALLGKWPFASFLLLVALAGFSRAIVGNYLSIYLKSYFGLKISSQGWVLAVRVGPEIVCFFASKWLVKALGPEWTLIMALVAGTLRVGGYCFIPLPPKDADGLPVKPNWGYAALALEPLKGINNALLVSAGAQLAHSLAPPGAETTAQGLFMGVHGNLATALAGLVGWLILGQQRQRSAAYPIVTLFAVTALISLLGLLLFLCHAMLMRCKRDKGK